MNSTRKIMDYLQHHFKWVAGFFIVFYVVGVTGMMLNETFPVFKKLIPGAILLSVFALAVFHQHFQKKELALFAAIYILAFLAEMIGVNTSLIFGNYRYGESLGIKLFNTPLIIGVNWLLLSYISLSVAAKLKTNAAVQIILASFTMLVYDVIIEQLAPVLDMWAWADNKVPVKNYLAWFVLAFFFNSILKIFNVQTANRLAPVILGCQLVFFIILRIVFKL